MEEEKVMLDPTQGCQLIGAFRAFHGIKDAYIVVHSPPDCHSGLLLLKSLQDNSDLRLAFTGIHPRDLVYGAEEKAMRTIKKVYERFHPPLIALLDACAPAIAGDDLDAVVFRLSEESAVKAKIIYFRSAGFHRNMWLGYENALTSLIECMKEAKDKREGSVEGKNTVNIIGFKDDEYRSEADISEIERMLKGIGVRRGAVFTSAYFKDILLSSEASLNVVLGGDGIKLARAMEKEFGIPYVVVDYPYGVSATEEFLYNICEHIHCERGVEKFINKERAHVRKAVEKAQFYLQGLHGISCAVVGDAARATALAKFLSTELGFNVSVLAFTSANFMLNECELQQKGVAECVLREPDRFEMSGRIENAGVQMIFGSTFEKKLANVLNVPLIRFSYPVIDNISLTNTPLCGFRGVNAWIENIVNAVVSRYYEV